MYIVYIYVMPQQFLVKPILFNGSIAVFQFFDLNVCLFYEN